MNRTRLLAVLAPLAAALLLAGCSAAITSSPQPDPAEPGAAAPVASEAAGPASAVQAAPAAQAEPADSPPEAGPESPWPTFRGPGAAGVAEGQEPPITWNAATGENILWKTRIPGLGHSSPVVWGDRIYLTSAINLEKDADYRAGLYGDIYAAEDFEDVHRLTVYALDAESGEILWERTAYEGKPLSKRHIKATFANSSPATDGEHVVALFGAEGLYVYDRQGELLWEKNLGDLDLGFYELAEYEWGYAASPYIWEGKVFIQVDTSTEEDFLVAFDIESGEELWRTERDELPSWGSPTVIEGPEGPELVTNASNWIQGYDPNTGEELWRLGGSSKITAPTPFLAEDLIVVASGRGPEAPIFAVRPGSRGEITLPEGETSNDSVAWSWTRRGSYMPTPIAYGGRLYVLNNNGVFDAYDLDTGEEIYRQRIKHGGSGFSGSPVAADGRIYLPGEDGTVFVVKAGPEFELLGEAEVGEWLMTTPALAHDRLYIRGREHLFAVEEGASMEVEPPAPSQSPSQAHWPTFRGPGAVGVADGQDLPADWDGPAGENVRWKTRIPGLAHSSPVVWGDRIYLTSAISSRGDADFKHGLYGDGDASDDLSRHRFTVYAVDAESGEIVWERTAREGEPRSKRHIKATYANSSPAVDGRHVIALFGAEGLYGFDVEGNLLWEKDLGDLDLGAYDAPDYEWGYAASPYLWEGKVFVQVDTQGEDFLLALDAETGEELWRTERDELPSWGSPTVVEGAKGPELVTNASNWIQGYDPETGEELWRLGGSSQITAPTPFLVDDLIIVASGRRPVRPLFAIRSGSRGDLTLPEGETKSDAIAWSQPGRGSYMPTPLAYDGLLYVVSNQGVLDAYDLETGEEIYRQRLSHKGSGFSASPVASDGKIYIPGEDGDVFVVKAGRNYELLATADMGELLMATPAIAHGRMYVRGKEHLFAVEEGERLAPAKLEMKEEAGSAEASGER